VSDDEQPRASYRFGAPETLGLIGAARASQCVLVGCGVAAAVALMYVLPVAVAPFALIPTVGAIAVAFVPIRGTVALDWGRLAAAFALDRWRGRTRFVSSTALTGAPLPATSGTLQLPRAWGRYRIGSARSGAEDVGVIFDDERGTASATLWVRVEAFALLAEADQRRRVEAFGTLLAALARESHPIRRIAWYERTIPAEPDAIATDYATRRDPAALPAAAQAYLELINGTAAAAVEHECFVSLQLDTNRRRAEIRNRRAAAACWDEAAALVVVDELVRVYESLRDADVGIVRALSPRLLASAIRHGCDPATRPQLARLAAAGATPGCAPGLAGPAGLVEHWDCVRLDSSWASTWWIASWPMRDVGVLFLSELLNRTSAERSLAVICEPLAPSRAHHAAELAVTREEGDAGTRERHGVRETARQRRRRDDARERERELSDGYAAMRFSGYVTVHARTREELESACADVQQAAQCAQLQLLRLVGQQRHALAFTLPGLCAGLE
jgi:hypothetical protein